MEKVLITYNGAEIWVEKNIADYLEAERKCEQAQAKSDTRHLSDKDIDEYDFDKYIFGERVNFVEQIESFDEAASLHRAMKSLTDVQRRRVHLYFFVGLSFAEIARKEGVNESNVLRSVGSAVKKLKKIFETTA